MREEIFKEQWWDRDASHLAFSWLRAWVGLAGLSRVVLAPEQPDVATQDGAGTRALVEVLSEWS